MTVTVNAPPTVEAGQDQSVEIGMLVTFHGWGHDPDGGSVSYSWALGPGAYEITGTSTASPSCRYNTPGAKTVWLVVRDDENDTAADTLTVTVANIPPVADAGSDQTLNLPDSGEVAVYFSASASYDPDAGTLSYSWNFGSGATPGSGSGVSPSCSYSTHGAKTVTLTVTDDEGGSDSDSITVTVKSDPTPIAAISPAVIFVDTPVSFDGSGSYDADDVANPQGGITKYEWELYREEENSEDDNGEERQILHSHTGSTTEYTFAEPGNYTMTLTVTDNDLVTGQSGSQSGSNARGTRAAPVPPPVQQQRHETSRT